MSQSHYVFRVSGRLSDRATHAILGFCDLEVTAAPPETIIHCHVPDEERLHRLLTLVSVLGLDVVSMQQVPRFPASPSSPRLTRQISEETADPDK
ncbi:hypothetical protein [Amycolatopsis sp. FDAARGOS 1241]|uniref:hypothetical protein n=1 Tax=Amycolatopsis sp. FDAARGOS 1241 TaxID=2778070 RepID=UPI001952659A|nr:hypothetical protein [Amycolatopsis sp. FDAARGOS 1241]QRP42820.1 hypothetical protein I6J71_25485 [Amycolatopsis sp. FDAARGOS 1241]